MQVSAATPSRTAALTVFFAILFNSEIGLLNVLEIYIIKAKSYKKIIPVFPLIYLGLHKIARSNVVHLRGKNIKVSLSEKQMLQADGEVVHDLSNIEIHSN